MREEGRSIYIKATVLHWIFLTVIICACFYDRTCAFAVNKPQVAIVVDDFGFSLVEAKKIADINLPLTWAIIPYKSYSAKIAEMARNRGIPFIVHLPMQAYSDSDKGPFLVGVNMSYNRIRQVVRNAIWSLPGTCGLNNHRGSRATSDRKVMAAVIDEIAAEGLLFLDSRTSSNSVAFEVARKAGVPSARNRVFLDGDPDINVMKNRFAQLKKIAKKNGGAVGICHVRENTIIFLESIYKSAHSDVEFVTVPEYLENYPLGIEEE